MITPYLALDAAKLEIDRYTEQGGSAAQTVGERVLERMDLSVGATYSASFKIGDGLLKPSATVAMTWNGESAGASVMRSSFGLFPRQNPNTRLSANCYKLIDLMKSEKNFWAINYQRNARNTAIF